MIFMKKTENRKRRHGDTENGKRKTDSRSPFSVLCFLCLCSLFSVFSIRAAEPVPPELQGIGITPTLGEMLPLSLTFQNEQGKTVALGSFFKGKKPVILALVYYECPNLCTFLLNGATEGLSKIPMTIGNEFDFVAVSIDPKETPELASQKKEAYLKEYGRPQAAEGWHFLVGQEENIKKLADSVGFSYRYDAQEKQYAHAAAIFMATPDGKVARVLQGIQFNPRDLRLALVESSEGKIGTFTDQVLLFCFRYDPKGSRYGLFASNLMKGAGAATLLFLGFLLIRLRRKKDNV